MKKILTLLFVVIGMSSCKAQDAETASDVDTTASIDVIIGKTSIFDGDNIRFDTVVDDSRCPEGLQCLWAGEAKVRVALLRNGKEQAQELAFGADGINESNTKMLWETETIEIHAVGLEPYPKEEVTIKASDYRIILKEITK